MTDTSSPFEHSTPELYDRHMGPLLFEPSGKVVAERAALLQPDRILETAAGPGIVTRALHLAVPQAQNRSYGSESGDARGGGAARWLRERDFAGPPRLIDRSAHAVTVDRPRADDRVARPLRYSSTALTRHAVPRTSVRAFTRRPHDRPTD